MRQSICLFILAAIVVLAGSPVSATETITPDARMLRFPDISAETIVFVFAGDLWTVPREGGLARRLSSPDGMETFPKFSPDGATIAFSANYDGNVDIYTVPTDGGVPTRLTHHSAGETVVEWYPDGQHILYRSNMTHPLRRTRFYKQLDNICVFICRCQY